MFRKQTLFNYFKKAFIYDLLFMRKRSIYVLEEALKIFYNNYYNDVLNNTCSIIEKGFGKSLSFQVDKNNLIYLLSWIGLQYEKLRDHKKAEVYYNNVLCIIQNIENDLPFSYHFINIIKFYNKIGQRNKSMNIYNRLLLMPSYKKSRRFIKLFKEIQ